MNPDTTYSLSLHKGIFSCLLPTDSINPLNLLTSTLNPSINNGTLPAFSNINTVRFNVCATSGS